MPRPRYSRHPLAPVFALALAFLAALLVALFLLDAITYAYRRIGIGQAALFALIWLSLLVGGLVNIPVARLRARETLEVGEIVVFGVRYRLPIVRLQQGSRRDHCVGSIGGGCRRVPDLRVGPLEA